MMSNNIIFDMINKLQLKKDFFTAISFSESKTIFTISVEYQHSISKMKILSELSTKWMLAVGRKKERKKQKE